ncbi:MAG: hypothetical protein ACK41D_09370 [Rubricoccaceae bacterium]
MPATLPTPTRATGAPQRTPRGSSPLELYLFMLMIALGVIAAIIAFARM